MPTPPSKGLARIQAVLERLLNPESGCPWDLKQTPDTIRLYFLEEAYELLEAVENGTPDDVKEELGDCFFLLCFLARLFEAGGRFSLEETLDAAADKMIARHPHIFSGTENLHSAEEVRAQWHQIKRREKPASLLGGVPRNLPALLRTHRLTERAARVGFDWGGPEEVLKTLEQEHLEFSQARSEGQPQRTAAELGDILFTLANLARHLKINAEDALRGANDRFAGRFQFIEQELARTGRSVEQACLEEMDALWDEAKKRGL
jgi:MazG family protein